MRVLMLCVAVFETLGWFGVVRGAWCVCVVYGVCMMCGVWRVVCDGVWRISSSNWYVWKNACDACVFGGMCVCIAWCLIYYHCWHEYD